jgi:LysM repeat protein
MFRIAGMGVGSAASSLRGPQAAPTARPATTPGANPTPAQGAGAQPAAPAQPTAAAAAPPAAAQPTAAPTATRAGQREHTVAAGDTLFAISSRYGTTVAAIVAANNLPSSSTVLNIGQRLIIPG